MKTNDHVSKAVEPFHKISKIKVCFISFWEHVVCVLVTIATHTEFWLGSQIW